VPSIVAYSEGSESFNFLLVTITIYQSMPKESQDAFGECPECYIVKNRLDAEDNTSDSEDNTSDDAEDVDFVSDEELIESAAAHARQARAERIAWVQRATEDATEDLQNGVPHSQRSYTIVNDFSQNLDVLDFGDEEEPGDTFYYIGAFRTCVGQELTPILPEHEEETSLCRITGGE
jgi:hypothetical protein